MIMKFVIIYGSCSRTRRGWKCKFHDSLYIHAYDIVRCHDSQFGYINACAILVCWLTSGFATNAVQPLDGPWNHCTEVTQCIPFASWCFCEHRFESLDGSSQFHASSSFSPVKMREVLVSLLSMLFFCSVKLSYSLGINQSLGKYHANTMIIASDYRRLNAWSFISLRSVNRTYAYAHWWSKIHYGYGEKCSETLQ